MDDGGNVLYIKKDDASFKSESKTENSLLGETSFNKTIPQHEWGVNKNNSGIVTDNNEKSSTERAAATTSVVDTPANTASTDSIFDNGEKVNKNNSGIAADKVSAQFGVRNPEEYRRFNAIGKRLGVKVVLEELVGEDGYYDPKTKELHINIYGQNPMEVIKKHEITHILEGTQKYDELVITKKIIDALSNPRLVLKNKNNGRINVISDIPIGKNDNSVISIEFSVYKNVEGNKEVKHRGNYNLIITLFSAKDNYTKNLVNKEDIEGLYQNKKDVSGSDLTTESLSLGNTKGTSSNAIISPKTENSQENFSNNDNADTKKRKLQEPETERESFAEYIVRVETENTALKRANEQLRKQMGMYDDFNLNPARINKPLSYDMPPKVFNFWGHIIFWSFFSYLEWKV